MKKAIALLFVSIFTMSAYAQEENAPLENNEKAWAISIDQAIYDKYVWRGIQLNEEGVNQGSVDFSYEAGDLGTVGFNYWYNMDLDNENSESGNFSEVDYALYWEKSFEALTLGAGYIYYDFSEVDAGSTREVYVSASYDTFLAPTVTVYFDTDDAHGFYVDLGIGHSFDLGILDATLDLGANLGWADDDQSEFYYESDANGESGDSGFTNFALSAAVNFPVGESVTITPSIMYYGLLEDANDEKFDDGESIGLEDDDFVFGINLNLTF
jgi:hypothetical protein